MNTASYTRSIEFCRGVEGISPIGFTTVGGSGKKRHSTGGSSREEEKMGIRWFIDLALVKNVIVGRVYQTPSTGDSIKGSIKPETPWQAYGMVADWGDTNLGTHASRKLAKQAVEKWVDGGKVL